MKMNRHIKVRRRLAIATTTLMFATVTPNYAVAQIDLFKDDDGTRICTPDEIKYIKELQDPSTPASTSSNGTVTGGSADSQGKAWLTEGTEEYEVAKEIYDFWTQEIGTSGAFAAGVLANVEQESGFIPNISEGGGRFPMPMGTTPTMGGPGGGLYQFTPYSKYTNSPHFVGGGWAVRNQSLFVWHSEFVTGMINIGMKNAPNTYGIEAPFTRAYTAIPGQNGTTARVILDKDALVTTDDPVKAAKGFQLGYERPANYHPEREPSAIQANAVFNKDNYKGDANKLKENLPAGGVVSGVNALGTIGRALSGAMKLRERESHIDELFATPCSLPDGTIIMDKQEARKYAGQACGPNSSVTSSGTPTAGEATAGSEDGNAYDRMANKDKLLPWTNEYARDVAKEFPEIQTIGGWRQNDAFPYHPGGRALDVMVPVNSELGDRIMEWTWANAEKYNVEDTIWKQRWTGASGASNVMEDRGSPTQNHRDHVHVTFFEEAGQGKDQNVDSDGQPSDSSSSKKKRGGLCNSPDSKKEGSLAANEYGVVIPAEGVMTSLFGPRWGSFHDGLDIANSIGTPIYAAADGEVISSGPADGYGLWVRIKHSDGVVTVYGHQIANHVKVGDKVTAGQHIADMGSQGFSTGSHLHFGVYGADGKAIDPVEFFNANGIDVPNKEGTNVKSGKDWK